MSDAPARERAEIVLRNMDPETVASVVNDLRDLGIKREAIRVEV
jgi:hypothetical protein